jgi:hypothetical protein
MLFFFYSEDLRLLGQETKGWLSFHVVRCMEYVKIDAKKECRRFSPHFPYVIGRVASISVANTYSAVWRIRDVYPGSKFFPSRITDPNSFHPGYASKNLSI